MATQNQKFPNNPQIEVIKSSKTGLFTNYIFKAIPLAFDESLSYYECLCGLLNYLKNVIIPTVNNNADAVTELQTLYEELRSYVKNYFDNLDVQEEINNKLDEMVEEGTIQKIIADYLNSKAIFGFDTVSSMKNATNLINGSYAQTLGYYNKNDGGYALYKIRNITNEDIIDEMFIIALNNNLIAELIHNNNINTKQIGINEDVDETNKLKNALNKIDNITICEGNYIFNNIELKDNKCIKNKGTIKSSLNDALFLLTDGNNIKIDGGIYLGDNQTQTQSLIKCSNIINCEFKNLTLKNALNKCIDISGNSKNNIIENISVSDCLSSSGAGISLSGADVQNNKLNNINAYNNRIGITLNGCHHNLLSNIYCENNVEMGITVDGIITDSNDGGTYNQFNNITILGTSSTNYGGIYLGNKSSYNSFENIVIKNCNNAGIRQTHSENESNAYGNTFNNIIIINCSYGIIWTGCQNNYLSNFYIDNCINRGIYLGRSDNCIIETGFVKNCKQQGIFIQCGYTNLSNIGVENNDVGIQLAFGLTQPINNIITNVDFKNNKTNEFVGVGSYIIDNCTGYVVHNFGTIQKSNNQLIPHNLSKKPTYVNVQSSVLNHICSVINITDTDFQISLTDNNGEPITSLEDIYWEARCK